MIRKMNYRVTSTEADPPDRHAAGGASGDFAAKDRTSSGPADAGSPDPGPRSPANFLQTVLSYLALWFGLLTCGVMFLGWCGIAFLTSPLLEAEQRRRTGRAGMHWLFRLYLAILRWFKIVRIDNAELAGLRHERSLILAPNHPSMLDVVLVISRLPEVGCIMKAELWDNIFLGAGARMADFIRNDSPRSMIKRAVQDLQRGSQLLIFPEATRTVREPVNELSGGFALIAKKANAPVQTILIESDSPYLRKGWSLFRLPPMPIRFRLRLGRRFEPRDDVESLVAELERYFIEELGEARPGIAGALAQPGATGATAACAPPAPARKAA
jgi:1-acyl-sn-glycerol-3-phosphate acyltransferase